MRRVVVLGRNLLFKGLVGERIPPVTSPLEARLARDYGSIFVTIATPPPCIVFRDEQQVREFQSSVAISRHALGEHTIELQTVAMQALVAAVEDASRSDASITARAADAGRRSYGDTVGLWLRNVERGLDHWVTAGRIDPEQAERVRRLPLSDQVETILNMEDTSELYFGTYFDRSILYSVAAPGSSQHLSLLAFDVKEYKDLSVEQALNEHGWYRTVVNDLPHFTYLGRTEAVLPGLGLKQGVRKYDGQVYRFWVPDLEQA
jgi:hypothetical protein